MKPRIFTTPNRFVGSHANCLIRLGMSLALCSATAHAATWDGAVVPEPGAALLGSLGTIGLLRRRRV